MAHTFNSCLLVRWSEVKPNIDMCFSIISHIGTKNWSLPGLLFGKFHLLITTRPSIVPIPWTRSVKIPTQTTAQWRSWPVFLSLKVRCSQPTLGQKALSNARASLPHLSEEWTAKSKRSSGGGHWANAPGLNSFWNYCRKSGFEDSLAELPGPSSDQTSRQRSNSVDHEVKSHDLSYDWMLCQKSSFADFLAKSHYPSSGQKTHQKSNFADLAAWPDLRIG